MSKPFTPPNLTEAVPRSQLWKQMIARVSWMGGIGAFVGVGIAADSLAASSNVEASIVWALTLAALVALGQRGTLSHSAAAAIPAGVCPAWLPFTADSFLLLAKLALTATAALGMAGYFLHGVNQTNPIWLVPMALLAIGGLTVITLQGVLHRPSASNGCRLLGIGAAVALLSLILAGLPVLVRVSSASGGILAASFNPPFGIAAEIAALLQATALLTVAYQDAGTGPSQAARSVKQTRIAGGMVILLQGLLYVGVALVSLRTIKASVFGTAAVVQVNSLMSVMQHLPLPGGASLIAAGGTVALAGLILKLLPQLATRFIDLNQSLRWSEQTQNAPAATPLSSRRAVRWVSVMLSCMVLAGDVKTLWSLSAFALLLQAAISHWIRFRYGLYPRFYGRWLQAFGCGVCLFLAFWIDGLVGLTSLGLVALGLVWRGMMQWSNEQE